MKTKLLILSLIIFAVQLYAQPEITIRDIQYQEDSALLTPPHDYPSPYEGQIVTVIGVVMTSPLDDEDFARLHSGAPSLYLQDPENPEWGGILVRFVGEDAEVFNALDIGMKIRCTGTVGEYYTTTQLNVDEFQAEDVIDIGDRPDPVPLTIADFVEVGTNTPNYLAEKWEHVFVEFQNVTTTFQPNVGYNTFAIFNPDNPTDFVVVGNNADYWRNTEAPQPGTTLEYVRGYIETRNNIENGWFMINPVYPDDMVLGDVIPPSITNLVRDNVTPGSADDVIISADVLDSDGLVQSVKLHYFVDGKDGGNQITSIVDMTLTAGNTYSATIPAQADGSTVSMYVEAFDDDGARATYPSDTVEGVFFYFVLDRELTIQDVQKSPFGSGYSAYQGYEVTVSGVVTASAAEIDIDGGQVYIQNGTGEWSGIELFGTEALNLSLGDDVTVTGTVGESYGVTQIQDLDNASQITVNGTADLPEPLVVDTETINESFGGELPAESYESVLIKYVNVTVTDENADGEPGPPISGSNSNFGEMFVANEGKSADTRVELQDGSHDYNNFWDESQADDPYRIKTWNHFDEIIGILYYSFGDFKLVPRTNDDFVGFVTGVSDESQNPDVYRLEQNYPNPFNPSTTIEFSLPQNNFVTLKIYSILGEEVRTLINSEMNTGVHKVSFDASQLPSGIYFYRLEAGEFVSTKKLMLLK